MPTTQRIHEQPSIGSVLCASCGIPADAEYFDEANIEEAPETGRTSIVVAFSLPAQYCGVLQYFSQYTDRFAQSCANVDTPGLEWMIRLNGRPMYPYVNLRQVVNPWGYGSFPIAIRLEENSTVEFAIRGVEFDGAILNQKPARVGGRLVGRYWYNPIYGDGEQ